MAYTWNDVNNSNVMAVGLYSGGVLYFHGVNVNNVISS